MNDLKLYYIRNIGCDDETCGLARMTDAELERFASIVKDLNKNSTYGCMPIIEIYRISEDMIREPTEDDSDYSLLYLDDKPYVLDDAWYVCLGEKGEMVV